ncbi:unnamed protein product [Caretta caretta]
MADTAPPPRAHGGSVADIPLPPVPLHHSSVSVLIRGFVADVGCQLLHRNEELGPVEAVFKFPVDAEAAVDAFQAWLRGACIQAQLQEKRQPPGEEAMLTLSYTYELLLEHDGAARYVLPTVLHPRYRPTPPELYSQGPTTAQVSLAQAPPWDRDLELLVYYAEPHKPSAVLEARLPGAEPGSLMGDPAVMMTLLPRVPEAETLVLLLKSLPLGYYFNIYGFGSEFESFYPQSVENTQQTKAESLQRLQLLQAHLGGTEILEPLRAVYRSPCRDGHPRQLFVFTDGEAENTQDIIAEVQHHWGTHSLCPPAGASPSASGTGPVPRQVLQSLKWAMQPAVTGISLSWDLPPGMQAELLHWDPEVIFAGQRCLVYAQLRGLPQPPDIPMGGITLQYRIQDQTYKETLQFSLQPQDGDRLPVQRLAAKSLLLELEGAVGTGSEGDGRWAVEASLSLGVVCSLTAYVGVDMERGQLVQGLLGLGGMEEGSQQCVGSKRLAGGWNFLPSLCFSGSVFGRLSRDLAAAQRAPEESPLLRLVSLQNADVWWNLDPHLAAVLGVSETDARGRIPSVDVTPSIWATVLAMVWLHGRAVGQRDESSCWRPRLWAGCGTEQVQTSAGQTFSS